MPFQQHNVASLGVNIDHIANVRQARRTVEPDPVPMALLAELGGADGITVHLREDRRHIQDRDVDLLRQTVRSRLNLEMAATDEMVEIALRVRPDMVTLVPERREEVTTEGGLDVAAQLAQLKIIVQRLHERAIPVSLFVDPDPSQLRASRDAGARWVELHTGTYAEASRLVSRSFSPLWWIFQTSSHPHPKTDVYKQTHARTKKKTKIKNNNKTRVEKQHQR